MRDHLIGLFLLATIWSALQLPTLAQGGALDPPEALAFDETTSEWHWTVMTGEGGFGYKAEYQRRAKASSTWPSSWTALSDVTAGDGRENVERRISIPSADFDRDTYDYRVRVYYQDGVGTDGYEDSPWTVSGTLEGYEPTTAVVTVSIVGANLVCAWTEPSSVVHQYEVRSRFRPAGGPTWGDWSSVTAVSASATRNRTLSTDIIFRLQDWECGVTTVLGTSKSSEATGSYTGTTLTAPTTVEIADMGSQLLASWSAVLEAASYQYRSASRLVVSSTWGEWSEWSATSGRQATLSSDSGTYSVRDWRVEVRSHHDSFQSPANGAEWEGREPGAPSPPMNLQVTRMHANQEDDALMARWNPPVDGSATGYQYRIRSRGIGESEWSTFGAESSTTDLEQQFPATNSAEIDSHEWEIQVRSMGIGSLFSQWIAATFMRAVASGGGSPSKAAENWSKLPEVTCGKLSAADNGIRVRSTFGLASGIECQEIGDAGIGIQSVIDAGYSAAVDVWSYVEQGAEICFEARGSLTFLDALTAPRTVRHIGHYLVGDQTCAWITSPGSIVLAPLREGDNPQAAPGQDSGSELVNCMVTTTTRVNFRSWPGGDLQGNAIDRGARLTAVERRDGWFRVDNMGVYGWISERYVNTEGACG